MLKRLLLVLLLASPVLAAPLAVKTVGLDRSNSGVAGLDDELARAAATAIAGKQLKLTSGTEEPSHLVTVQLTVVKESATQLEITGTATVTEDGNLRFATRVGAAVEVSTKLTPPKLAELAREGTKAIGQRLGEECGDWLRQAH